MSEKRFDLWKRRPAPPRLRAGISLLECMVFTAMFPATLAIGALCYRGVLDLRYAQARHAGQVSVAEHVLRVVRAETLRARGFLDSAAGMDAGEGRLILDTDDGPLAIEADEGALRMVSLANGEGGELAIVSLREMRIVFGWERASPSESRWAHVTVEWEGESEIGVSQPVLSLLCAPRSGRQDP